jgi:hypothetical protein
MSDPSPSACSLAADEMADRRQMVTVASIASLVVAAVVGLVSGQWLPILVLVSSFIVVWIAAGCSGSSSPSGEDGSENGRASADKGSWFSRPPKVAIVAVLLVLIAGTALIARWAEPLRWLLDLGFIGLLVAFVSTLLLAARAPSKASRAQWATWSAVGLVSAALTWLVTPPAYASIHPVFHTPVSGKSVARPAVLVGSKKGSLQVIGTSSAGAAFTRPRGPGAVLAGAKIMSAETLSRYSCSQATQSDAGLAAPKSISIGRIRLAPGPTPKRRRA